MNPALLEYGRALRRRWRWIVWGLLLTLGATALFLLVEPPLYRSEATVFVRTPGDVSRVLDGGDSYAQGRARTYSALARSTDLAARVVENAGLDVTPEVLSERIDASPRQGTALIDVSVDAASAAESRRTATVFLAEYAATVRTLESVPGSLVPRAELVVVDRPGRRNASSPGARPSGSFSSARRWSACSGCHGRGGPFDLRQLGARSPRRRPILRASSCSARSAANRADSERSMIAAFATAC